jgi:rubredoxin
MAMSKTQDEPKRWVCPRCNSEFDDADLREPADRDPLYIVTEHVCPHCGELLKPKG